MTPDPSLAEWACPLVAWLVGCAIIFGYAWKKGRAP